MSKIVRDDFNSENFHMEMGNIIDVTIDDLDYLLEQSKNKYEHLSVKISSSDLQTCNYFLRKDFYLVDTLITYRFDYHKYKMNESILSEHLSIEKVEKKDVLQLCKIAEEVFKIDRFHNDLNLDAKKCDQYYHKWLFNSCAGFADIVYVCKNQKQQILGFITGKSDQKHAYVGLNAVVKEARNQGIAAAMINKIMKYYEHDCDYFTIGTQLSNTCAISSWIKLGLKPYHSTYVLHKKL